MNSLCKLLVLAVACGWLVGCGKTTDPAADNAGTSADSTGTATVAPASRTPSVPPTLTAVAVEDGIATIDPTNSRVVFVGTHADPEKPDPRTGGFSRFGGQLAVADGKVTSISVKMDGQSIFTFDDKLTTHLKNADFFEVNEFPTAEFKSTQVAADMVSGDLTLHGVTKAISFPATIEVTDDGATLWADFEIDRTDFGMDYKTDTILKTVQLNIAVGAKTDKEEIIGGSKGQAGRRGGQGGWDPMKMFADRDKDKDGMLSGDEIPERMQSRLERIDTDSDGKVSKEEMQEIMKNRQNRSEEK
ncbi:MAG: YceI family protein [Planctomycetaceae bacterium]